MRTLGIKNRRGHNRRFTPSGIKVTKLVKEARYLLRDYNKDEFHRQILLIVPGGNNSSGVIGITLDKLAEKLYVNGKINWTKMHDSLILQSQLGLIQAVPYEGKTVYSRTIIGDSVTKTGITSLDDYGGIEFVNPR